MSECKDIDFVITWVDGSDPAWLREKAYCLNPDLPLDQIDFRDTRYRDWDNLRYWFRAVETYAPWVRKVHLVTWGHVPQWLNLEAPKLQIDCHEDFIPEQYLPTFSSHPIELNLHRIPGLAEQFVYFNDDFFLTAPVAPEDFFLDGLPRDSLEESPLLFTMPSIMNSVNTNDVIFANQHFRRDLCRKQNRSKWFSLKDPHAMAKNLYMLGSRSHYLFGLNIHHLPQAYRKDTFGKVWQADPELLNETCTHKFRSASDVSQCVFKFWQLMSGTFQPYDKHKAGRLYQAGRDFDNLCDSIRTRRYKYICFNDADEIDFESHKIALNEVFEQALPRKSSFEK